MVGSWDFSLNWEFFLPNQLIIKEHTKLASVDKIQEASGLNIANLKKTQGFTGIILSVVILDKILLR